MRHEQLSGRPNRSDRRLHPGRIGRQKKEWKMTVRSLLLPLVAAAALYPAGATAAQISVGAVPSVKVSFADLDVSAKAGREALSKRIASAAKMVCGRPSAREIKAFSASAQCRENALVSGNLQVERLLATRLAASERSVEVSGSH
jgi:UrcA family protein